MDELLKSRILALPYTMLLSGYFAHYAFQGIPETLVATRREGLKHFANLGWRPKTETLFILGSGWSINELSANQFDTISRFDSVGFNFWPLHWFKPDLYTVEAIDADTNGGLRRPALEKFAETVFQRRDYAAIPKFLTDFRPEREETLHRMCDEWQSTMTYLPTIPIFARNYKETADALSYLRESGLFQQTDLILKYRATLSMLVSMGICHGFKRIVLCGIDITDPRYFWHDSDQFAEHSSFLRPKPGVVHGTGRELPLMATIQEVLRAIRDVVATPMGVEIFVASKRSALWPEFPLLRV